MSELRVVWLYILNKKYIMSSVGFLLAHSHQKVIRCYTRTLFSIAYNQSLLTFWIMTSSPCCLRNEPGSDRPSRGSAFILTFNYYPSTLLLCESVVLIYRYIVNYFSSVLLNYTLTSLSQYPLITCLCGFKLKCYLL